jgi:hypothetical protein
VAHEQTSEEIFEEFQKAYPKVVAELAFHLWNAICYLNLTTSTYSQLYSSKKVIEVLNGSSPRFFNLLRSCLPWTIYFQIGRLTDPAQSRSSTGTRSNASFAGFSSVLREAGETTAADMLDNDFKALEPALKKVRTIRNRMLAHADLNTVLRKGPPPPLIAHTDIETLVDQINKTYIRTDGRFRKKEIYFKGISAFSGVDELILYLDRGIQSFKQREFGAR